MFHKSAKRLTQSVRAHLTILQFTAMSKAHGIEVAFIMAGSIINQDASLGYSYTMPGRGCKYFIHMLTLTDTTEHSFSWSIVALTRMP